MGTWDAALSASASPDVTEEVRESAGALLRLGVPFPLELWSAIQSGLHRPPRVPSRTEQFSH
eukprot:5566452-Prorocentrum_lima.AAC.1